MQRALSIGQRVALLALLAALVCPALAQQGNAQLPEFDAVDAAAKRRLNNYQGFVFDFFTGKHQEPSPNGFQVQANVGTDMFTAFLDDEGNSLNLLNLGPCAGNSPHVHPRGSEISTIVRGKIQFGFVEENAGQNRLVIVDAHAGQVVFVPQGLLHFSHNQECTPAAFIANFGTRDPGTQTIWAALMQVPTPILAASLNIHDDQDASEKKIEEWKQRMLVHAPATGGASCLRKCQISYKDANNFTASPASLAQNPGPIIPNDQLGNPQSFEAGGVLNNNKRCDFLGLTQLGAHPNPQECAPTDNQPQGGQGGQPQGGQGGQGNQGGQGGQGRHHWQGQGRRVGNRDGRWESNEPEYQGGYYPGQERHDNYYYQRRLQAAADKLGAKLPQDRITVMDRAEVEKLSQE